MGIAVQAHSSLGETKGVVVAHPPSTSPDRKRVLVATLMGSAAWPNLILHLAGGMMLATAAAFVWTKR
jgi:hypothetical protein